MIDPHVHCRDWGQDYKETISHALHVAERAGLSGIFDMPNTNPAIISRELIERRLMDAESVESPVFYGLYAGLTSNPQQIGEVVKAWEDYFPREGERRVGVVGLKMFAGRSVGDLSVVGEEDQKRVYDVLTELGYEGVLAVHCEKESLMRPNLWDPSNPISHCYARPPEAEVESVRDQIEFARAVNFKGKLHIVHVSVPESVPLINGVRESGDLNISCGVTPHHIVLNQEFMRREDGLLYKVNPPLREKGLGRDLLELLRKNMIDFIETDHAPHTLNEKTSKPHMSGFPGFPFYNHFLNYLRQEGFDEEQIIGLTHRNINITFGLNLPDVRRVPDLDLFSEYGVNVYGSIK